MMEFSKNYKRIVSAFAVRMILLLGVVFCVLPAIAKDEVSDNADEIFMIKGELETIRGTSLTRVSISEPNIVDVVEADDKKILIVAKSVGRSPVFLWDKNGKRTIMVYVVSNELKEVKEQVEQLLKAAMIDSVNVSISYKEGKVLLSGEIITDEQADFKKIYGQYNDDIINLVRVGDREDMIQVDLQVTELNETLQKSLGIDWSTGGTSGIAPAYTETVPVFNGKPEDFLKIGDFSRTGQLVAAVNALITEGKGRVLSKPRLVVASGKEARFLVGGQVPVRTTVVTDSGATQENVAFRDFGINMTVTPQIKREKISIRLGVDISELDSSTASTISEDIAFSTRQAATELILDDGQTIVLAGLIKKSSSENVTRIPFVSNIPIVGLLFRSKQNPVANLDQELVISLTPHRLTNRIEEHKKEALADQSVAQDESASTSQGDGMNSVVRPVIAQEKSSGLNLEMEQYVRSIQEKIAAAFVYPPEAKNYGWAGTVKLGLHILSDGTLAFATVTESSGYDIFDQYALNAAKKTAPYSHFPSATDLQELNVVVPIVYTP